MNKKLLLIFFNIFLLNYFQLCSQTTGEPIASFTLKGVVKLDGRLAKGVSLELTKDGREISKTITQRNGKYSFLMDESTTDTKNEYLIHISKEGAIPKTLSINTYVPKE